MWILPAGGNEPRVVLRDVYDNSAPAWGLDGSKLVFVSNRAGPPAIWEIEIASRRLRRVTTGAGEDVYPAAGKRGLRYDHHLPNFNLHLIDVATKGERQVTFNTGRNYWPRFSPDGRRIAYHSNQTGNWELWTLDLDTKVQRVLTNHPAADLAPEWSPDGRRITFRSNRENFFQLWLLDLEQGVTRFLTRKQVFAPSAVGFGGGGQVPAYCWSPDGRKIGVLVDSQGDPALWSVDRDGRNARQLLTGVLAFDWYRDSGHVVCTRRAPDGSGAREMSLVDLSSGRQEVLYRGPHVDIAAAKGSPNRRGSPMEREFGTCIRAIGRRMVNQSFIAGMRPRSIFT